MVKCTNFSNNTSQLINFINRDSPYVLHEFLRDFTFAFILAVWTSNYPNTKEFYGTYYDAMELLKIAKMKNRSLVIIAKTNFCSLILQMLVRYVGLKLYLMCGLLQKVYIKNFRNILTCI